MGELGGIGRALLIAGVVLVVIGAWLTWGPRVPGVGRMPGDFTFEGRGWKVFFPLGTSLAISVILTLVLWLMRRR